MANGLPSYLEDTAKDYAKQATGTYSVPIDTSKFTGQQFVAGEDPLQTSAINLAQQGVGSYTPYLQAAQAGLTQAGTDVGAARTAAGGLGALTGKDAYQDFMSPYQQQVIDATLGEYDVQSAKGLAGIGQQAALSGQFLGGGREGVQRAEYQSASDRNRALLQAQMLQQGYGQAGQAASQAYGQQLGLGQATGALGQQQLGIGQYQQGLAGLVPQLYGQDTAAYGAAGAQQQAQAQAEADATREAARMEAYEPYERLGYLGTGITGMLGGYPGQYQSQISPNPTPLQSALGIGTGLAGMYGAYDKWKNP